MRFSDVVVASIARVDAPERVSTEALEVRLRPHLERLGILPGTLGALSGVHARRFFPEDTPPSAIAAEAGAYALELAGISPDEVGVLINTSVCRDFVEPSTACLVHASLGLPETCLNFDVSNACLGFLDGMSLVGQMIERGQVDFGLVVDGESSRFVVERTLERLEAEGADPSSFRDALATLTLGSGGAAALLCHASRCPDGHRLVGGVGLAASEHNHLCRGQVDWMQTNATGLLEAGLELASRTFARAQTELGWRPERLGQVVIHQVGRAHTEQIVRRLGLDLSRVPSIFPEHGNIGPASIPMTLCAAAEEGRLAPGDRVALMGIGSGLNCAMWELVW